MSRRQRHFGYRLAAAGLAIIAILTLLPHPDEAGRAASTPVGCIVCGARGGVDFVLNILLFIPLGLGLALAGFSWRRVLALAGLISFTIELLQMKVVAGRDASLGDILTNTMGSGIGAYLGAHWRVLVSPSPTGARRLAMGYALALTWIWAGTAWAIGPTWPTGSPWYGQWAPDLGHLKPFTGIPLKITAGGEPLLPGRALDESRLEDAVAANPMMAFQAVLGPPPTALAPVGAIYDGRQREVLLIGQSGKNLEFRFRMRSNILKLRNPAITLRNGMASQPGDTVEAEGALRGGAFELKSFTGSEVTTRRLPLSASWGWALVAPWDPVLGADVHVLTGLWLSGLLALLAYWTVLGGGASLVIPPATILLLLWGVPSAAGFPPAHWSEWLSALIGIMAGWLAARPAQRQRERAVPDSEDALTTLAEATP